MGQEKGTLTGKAIFAAIPLWVIGVFFGTASTATSRRANPITSDGKLIVPCIQEARGAAANPTAAPGDWCLQAEGTVIGPDLPADVSYTQGEIVLDRASFNHTLWETLSRPEFWLATSLGILALWVLFIFARNSGTLRTGIAASVTVVFLGLLLFPGYMTQTVPADLRSELIGAWKLLIVFYFGSEAAVQAWKVVHPEGKEVTGDMTVTTPPTTGPPAAGLPAIKKASRKTRATPK